jgi:diguanylate cyclase (GGDEF)-like protein
LNSLELLDPRTLAIAASLAGLVFSTVLWAALRDGEQVPGARYWFFGAVLISIGLSGNALQDLIADFLPRVVANVTLVTACFLLWLGARVFNGRNESVIGVVIIASTATFIGNVLFTLIAPSVQGRIALTSTALMVGCFLTALEIHRVRAPHLRIGVWVTMTPLLLFGLFMGIRTIHGLFGTAMSTTLVPTRMNVATHLLANVVLLTVMAGLVILVNSTRAAQIRALAFTDHLTGVLSRRGFYAKLRELKSRPGSIWYVFVFDIDRFKVSNDQKGHETGDQLLKLLISSIEARSPEAAVIARFGGDEFVMVCPGPVDAEALCATVRKTFHDRSVAVLNTSTLFGRSPIALEAANVSVGYATCTSLDEDSVALALRDADHAMYESKVRQRDLTVPPA